MKLKLLRLSLATIYFSSSSRSTALQASTSNYVRKALPINYLGHTTDGRRGACFREAPHNPVGKPSLLSLRAQKEANSVLAGLGNIFGQFGGSDQRDGMNTPSESNVVERYFSAWNRRDMEYAVSCFTEDCEYEDTQYSDAFRGKAALRKHLFKVSDALPETFKFVVDDLAVGKDRIGVLWHVENNGSPLPFTRGCSFYTLDEGTGLIRTGFDVPEPAPLKPGGAGLALLSQASKIIDEPVRAVPLLLWFSYIYVVFFSNGILPGADALQLELSTWEEVRDLSLNFFLVAPLLKLSFSPVVHPMLEGIFNVLLSWAALFAGFLSDDREDKPNALPMLPIIIGMQFLTSAFYLPYLASRTSEAAGKVVFLDELGKVERTVGESRVLGPFLGGVGTISILWAFLGRPEFGPLQDRYSTLIDLLSIDRVGSSFVVDLIIFGLFQGWLVDDDLRRRGVQIEKGELGLLRAVAKFLPFFGLAFYMSLRPKLPVRRID